MSKRILTSGVCAVLALLATPAFAQEDAQEEESEGSDSSSEGESSDSSASASAEASGSVSASGVSAAVGGGGDSSGGTLPPPPGGSDHSGVVGTFGIGYMGYRTMMVGSVAAGGSATVEAPVLGLRYWMSPDMGLDVGLGISFAGASTTTEAAGTSTDAEAPEPLAFILHAGVPLALSTSRHFVFEVVPEMNIGFASNTVEVGMADVEEGGFHLDIGARAGAEIHFGFIDIPELAIQTGIGLRFAMDSYSVDDGEGNSVDYSRNSFGTTVADNPWNIFTANVAALYYFD